MMIKIVPFSLSWQGCQLQFANLPTWILAFCQLANLKSDCSIHAALRANQVGKLSNRNIQVGKQSEAGSPSLCAMLLSWHSHIHLLYNGNALTLLPYIYFKMFRCILVCGGSDD